MVGKKDTVVNNQKNEDFYQAAASEVKEMTMWPEGRHMLHKDVKKEKVFARVFKFLLQRMTAYRAGQFKPLGVVESD